VQLCLARDIGQVRDVLRESGELGHVYMTVQEALASVTRPG
jgi:hypothetical protein